MRARRGLKLFLNAGYAAAGDPGADFEEFSAFSCRSFNHFLPHAPPSPSSPGYKLQEINQNQKHGSLICVCGGGKK